MDANLYRYVQNSPVVWIDPTGNVWYKPWTWFSNPPTPPAPPPSGFGLPKNPKDWSVDNYKDWFERRMNAKCSSPAKKQLFLDEQMKVAKKTGNRKAAEAIALLMVGL